MSLVLAAGLVVFIAVVGALAFCLVFGAVFLIAGLVVLKKKDDIPKYHVMRIGLIALGAVMLFISVISLAALLIAFFAL